MNLTWQNTRIGSEPEKHDFTARTPAGIDVGRIYRIDGGPQKGQWFWTFLLGHSQFRRGAMTGECKSKQLAANKVSETFERYMETPGLDGGGMSRIPLKKNL